MPRGRAAPNTAPWATFRIDPDLGRASVRATPARAPAADDHPSSGVSLFI